MPDKNAYLKAMGIDVWLERSQSSQNTELDIGLATSAAFKTTPQSEPTLQPVPEVAAVQSASEKHPETKETISDEGQLKVATIDVNALDWPALERQVSACPLCELAKTRACSLPGAGNKKASLMIIGDAPTEEDENNQDIFSGAAGVLLTSMLKAMGYQRQEVYLTNSVKCKTQNNQNPSSSQLLACQDYLLRQVQLIEPKLILAMGNIAAQSLLKTKSTMARLRGKLHYIDGVKAPVLVSYHPTYLLAAANEKRKAWQDLQLAMKELTS